MAIPYRIAKFKYFQLYSTLTSPFSEIVYLLPPYSLPLLDLVVNDELGVLVEHRVSPFR